MNYKYILPTLVTIGLISVPATAKVNEKKFSSKSTICRELDFEKDKAYKAKFKHFKEKYDDIKDIVIEKWNDGKTYYVLYDNDGKIALIELDTEKLLSGFCMPMFYDNMEYVERSGHKFFRIDDNKWMFHDGTKVFNPNTDFNQLGGQEYIIVGNKPINIYAADGTMLLSADRYEFRAAEGRGCTLDKETGLSIYHSELPNRFFGRNDYSDNYSFEVPGGEYLVNSILQPDNAVNTEVREDINGNIHEYKVLEISNNEPVNVNSMNLCYHHDKTGTSILPYKACKIRISTPDQIVYYNYNDNDMVRIGCVSLVDTSFQIPPKFNDVKVFYDGETKPYALVRLSALLPYELYDSNKTYDYSQLTELQKLFEKKDWNGVISKVQPSKLENLPVENIYPWLFAEIESLKNSIDYYTGYVVRLNTGSLHTFEEQELIDKANGRRTYYTPIQFGPTIEEALSAHISKLNTVEANKYKLMMGYLQTLKKQKDELDEKIKKSEANYLANKRNMKITHDAARRKLVMDAESARVNDTNHQQIVMISLLRSLFGIDNVADMPKQRSTSSSTMPHPAYTASMLERTSISPEIVGAAISSGWTPETPTVTSNTHESSNVSSGNICQACFGSKKCGVCHGQGRYMPNLDGKFIDCTSCGKSGTCRQCNGQGHH